MSNHQCLSGGMRWLNVTRLEAGQCGIQICGGFNLMSASCPTETLCGYRRENLGKVVEESKGKHVDKLFSIKAIRKRDSAASFRSPDFYTTTNTSCFLAHSIEYCL